MRTRAIWQAFWEAWHRFNRETLDSEGNPLPAHGAIAWLISGIVLGCGCVVAGIVVAFPAWYIAGQDAVWQASVGAIIALLGIWQIEDGIRQTTVYVRGKKLRRRHRV